MAMITTRCFLALTVILAVSSAAYSGPKSEARWDGGCDRVVSRGPSAAEKTEIVDLHNKLRKYVASGKERRGRPGPQPPTRNMKDMEWSDELAKNASNWANKCIWGHDPNLNMTGQNMGYNTPSRGHATMTEMITKWYNEVEYFNANWVKSFPWSTGRPATGHYSQIVWGATTQIGCGIVRHIIGGQESTFLVCNYRPAGNMVGNPVY